MGDPILDKTPTGQDMHYSVGGIVIRDGMVPLYDRVKKPFGYAPVAGHVDIQDIPKEFRNFDKGFSLKNLDDHIIDRTFEHALERELKEESGLILASSELIYDRLIRNNSCSKGIQHHHWRLYLCDADGELSPEEEGSKDMQWYHISEIESMKLEPVWKMWFKRLHRDGHL